MPSIPLTPTAQGGRQSTGVKSCLRVPCPAALHIPALSSSWAGGEHSTASPSSLLCKAAFFVGQLRRRGGIFFLHQHQHTGQESCCWEQSAQQGRAKGEPCVLHQCYQTLPSVGFLFTGMENRLVEHLAALSLCLYPHPSYTNVNREPVR